MRVRSEGRNRRREKEIDSVGDRLIPPVYRTLIELMKKRTNE